MADVRVSPWFLASDATNPSTGRMRTSKPFRADLEAQIQQRILQDSRDGRRVYQREDKRRHSE